MNKAIFSVEHMSACPQWGAQTFAHGCVRKERDQAERPVQSSVNRRVPGPGARGLRTSSHGRVKLGPLSREAGRTGGLSNRVSGGDVQEEHGQEGQEEGRGGGRSRAGDGEAGLCREARWLFEGRLQLLKRRLPLFLLLCLTLLLLLLVTDLCLKAV